MVNGHAYPATPRSARRVALAGWVALARRIAVTALLMVTGVAAATAAAASTASAATAAAAGASAADTTPPTAPGATTIAEITETSIRLTWTASTDDVGVASYEVARMEGDVIFMHRTPTNEISISELRPSRTYGFSVRARDAAGNSSSGNGVLWVTMPPGDTQPPTVPGRPVATELTGTSVTLTWSPSRDNVYVGRYEVLSITPSGNKVVGNVPQHPPIGLTTRIGNLTPGETYTFAVRAYDDAGNVSALSEPLTLTTPGQSTPGCAVRYRVLGQWPGGYQVEVGITNGGPAPINGWTLAWTLRPDQRVSAIWGAELVNVVDSMITVRNAGYTAQIPVGSSVTFGMTGTGSSGTPAPTDFRLNGASCAADGT